jgi:hypothetical protein
MKSLGTFPFRLDIIFFFLVVFIGMPLNNTKAGAALLICGPGGP